MTNERLTLTIYELADKLGISRNAAYELAKMDKLPVKVIRLGKRLVVSSKDVENILGELNLSSNQEKSQIMTGFKCERCGKIFPKQQALAGHKKVHNNQDAVALLKRNNHPHANKHVIPTIRGEDDMKTKICSKCKQEKTISDFYTSKRDGYRSRCKDCEKEDIREYIKTEDMIGDNGNTQMPQNIMDLITLVSTRVAANIDKDINKLEQDIQRYMAEVLAAEQCNKNLQKRVDDAETRFLKGEILLEEYKSKLNDANNTLSKLQTEHSKTNNWLLRLLQGGR